MSNELKIINRTDEDILILVSPNRDWALGDIVGSVGSILVTAAFTIVTFGAAVPSTVKAFISSIYFVSKGAYTGVHLAELLKEGGALTIGPGQTKVVFDRTMWNPFDYLTPSAWAALLGGSDTTLHIVKKSMTRQVVFNSNSDWTWVVLENDVVRAKDASSIPEPGLGLYPFSIADRLKREMLLKAGESIAAQNQDTLLVMQTDGNLVIYANTKPQRGKAIWASGTSGKGGTYFGFNSAGIYIKQDDGTIVWEQVASGGKTLIMQDDHNLVLYNTDATDDPKNAIWASHTSTVSGIEE